MSCIGIDKFSLSIPIGAWGKPCLLPAETIRESHELSLFVWLKRA
jgi:hypothetical protein